MPHRPGFATPAFVAFLSVGLTLLAACASASVYQFYDGVGDPPPNYPTGGNGQAIFTNLWAAQSFEASANYSLARVDLWALAAGVPNNLATLEVRAGNASNPDMMVPPLATATTTAWSYYGWVGFNVAPNILLTRGATYWIVLESNASSASRGWTWWNTGNETFLASGQGDASSDAGESWTSVGGDFAFRTFGYTKPSFQIAMVADRSVARPGEVVTFSIFFNNTGSGSAAQIWVNDTLPAGLTYLSDNASASQGIRGEGERWAFSDVAPGVHYFLLKATIAAGVANQTFLVNRVDLAYTDFRGISMDNSSATVTVTVTAWLAGSGMGDGVGYLFFAAVLAWILAFGFWPRGRLEQVFLVDNGGTLVAHLATSDNGNMDRDIFVGMLTAVQAFVRDSFAEAKEGELKRMDFGPRKMYIRRGSHSYLVAVLNGRTPPTLRRKMQRTLARVEEKYGEILANWSGDTNLVEGTTELLSAGLIG